VEECEQCGDYIVNVVEAKTGHDMDKRTSAGTRQ
jgi:hypothetical protein